MEQIKIEHMTKIYNGIPVLNQINHTFTAGQSIAFMGHNGCGKSTLLKIIAGLIPPTYGKVICPGPILFHYVPEKFMPLPLTARVYLKRMGELDGLKKELVRERIETLGSEFFLTGLLDIPMRHLSKERCRKSGSSRH